MRLVVTLINETQDAWPGLHDYSTDNHELDIIQDGHTICTYAHGQWIRVQRDRDEGEAWPQEPSDPPVIRGDEEDGLEAKPDARSTIRAYVDGPGLLDT